VPARLKMHVDELDVGEDLVRTLLTAQLPEHADLPLRRQRDAGTVNAIYRLGDDLVVRLPLTPRWHSWHVEADWLRFFASPGRLPVAVPEPVLLGEPTDDYPHRWGVLRWIEGTHWSPGVDDDVDTIVAVIRAIEAVDLHTLPRRPLAGAMPLGALDESVRAAADASAHLVDRAAFIAAWTAAVAAPPFDAAPGLQHGDLLPGNVLVRDGAVHAVIDWAGLCRSDPARELICAWSLFDAAGRARLRAALDVDDATWARSKGWALNRIHNVAYYEHSNPLFSLDARRTISEVLADVDA